RAHDAWSHLQQLSVTLGNWRGEMEYGLRGWSVNGKEVLVKKRYIRPLTDDLQSRPLPFDIEDFLRVGQTLKEWFFFANSVVDGEGAVVPSHGRFSYVQYRYSPATVNVGYEYGSIET